MNCEQFESLLADAIGDELVAAERVAFDEHRERCDRCRTEYESLMAAVSTMRSNMPEGIPTDHGVPFASALQGAVSRRSIASRPFPSFVRYAAAAVLAFTAGYMFRGEQVISSQALPLTGPTTIERTAIETDETTPHRFTRDRGFESALAAAHSTNPARSDLAKCMIAMFADRR